MHKGNLCYLRLPIVSHHRTDYERYSRPVPLPERALIGEIRRLAVDPHHRRPQSRRPAIVTSIGDDCAVLRLPAVQDFLVTTDFSLEGIHFRRDWHSPESAGHRCVARGLSDIAAMGGEPLAIFLSLALPPDLSQSWVRRFLLGLTGLAQKHGASLAGGDTSQSPRGILADIIVVGTVPKGKAVLRSGAQPGDRIFVTGELGGSAAAVVKMENRKSNLKPKDYPKHFFPEPRVELGRVLRENGLASAMIDTSDGLSTDLSHICKESGVGAEIDSEQLPRARVGKPEREVSLDLALHGGEDYELLFTAPRAVRVPGNIRDVTITEIGRITRSKNLRLVSAGKKEKLVPRGWEYFRER
jgi:thiamine-monophosphate kinase